MKRTLFLAVLALLLLTGCQSKPSVETDLAFLTSESCAGRLPGSEGNQRAADYIREQFSDAGLEPYGTDYSAPYTQLIFDPSLEGQTLTAVFADGSQQTFHSGTDFYPYLGSLSSVSGPVTTDPDDPELDVKVLVSREAGGGALLRITDSQKEGATDAGSPSLSVDPALFETLQSARSITLEGEIPTTEAELENVVGILRGTEHTGALFLTAHFDHIGSYGDVVYAGALDNASGVSCLLEVLRQLTADDQRPAFDIYFCAFNGEDMGMLGSAAFAAGEFPYDTINVINFDTVGWSEASSLLITETYYDSDDPLSAQLMDCFSQQGVSCQLDEYGGSDHLSFLEAGIPAVTIASIPIEVSDSPIHTPEDTVDHLDLEEIREVASLVAGYVMDSQLVPPSETGNRENGGSSLRDQSVALAREAGLDHDEVLYTVLDGVKSLILNTSPYASIEEARQDYPDLTVPPEQLGDYVWDGKFYLNGATGDDFAALRWQLTEEQAAGYVEGEVYPKPDWMFYLYSGFLYEDPEGNQLRILVMKTKRVESHMEYYETQDVSQVNGYTVIQYDTDVPSDGEYNALSCDNPETGYSVILSTGTLDQATDLAALFSAHCSELISLTPLE